MEALIQLEVSVIFGIPSVHNLPIFDALSRTTTIRTVIVRNEHAAASAADGYSRISGQLGVCLTSTGPGAANSMGGLVEAFTSGSPILHLTGQIETRFLDRGRGFIHEVPRQPEMLRAASKAVLRVQSPSDIKELVLLAGYTASAAPQGPVAIELPIDVQYAPVTGSVRMESLRAPKVEFLGTDELRDAGRRIAAVVAPARRPIIWVGGGAIRSGAEAAVAELARKIGAGIVTTPNARGIIPENDPLCIGNLPWDPDVRTLISDADVLLGIGTRYRGPNTENWAMALPKRIIQIDVEPEVPGRNYTAELAVRGDARRVVEAILGCVDEIGVTAPTPSWIARISDIANAARKRLREAIGPHVDLLDQLAASLDPDTVVVKDSTIPAYTWGNRLLPVHRTRRSIMSNSFAIGLAIPHSIGACIATGGPVVCMVGDGGIMVSLGELASISEAALPVIVLVFNDGGYGVLRNMQTQQYGRTFGVDLGRPDFCMLAEALGIGSVRVGAGSSLGKCVREAVTARSPFLIEVDMGAIGPMPQPYTGTSKHPEPPIHTTST